MLRMAPTLADRLTPWRCADTVGSLIAEARTWNIRMRFGKGMLLSSGANLLYIGNDQSSAGPFNIQLSAPQFSCLSRSVDETGVVAAHSEDGILTIGSTAIDVRICPSYTTQAPHLEPKAAPVALDALTDFLDRSPQTCGLDPQGMRILAALGQCLEGNVTRGRITCHTSPSDSPLLPHLSALLGRGTGATPSGDDAIVGMMAILDLPAFSSAVASCCKASGITVLVSQGYLNAALARRFDHDVCQMLDAMNRQDIPRLLHSYHRIASHGHSSGIDLLTGVQLALKII